MHFLFKPVARFELATSSLPRRHTAGLCHTGDRWNCIRWGNGQDVGIVTGDVLDQ